MYYTGVKVFSILLPHTNQIQLDEKDSPKKRLRNRTALSLFEESLLTLVRIGGFDLKYLADVFVFLKAMPPDYLKHGYHFWFLF